MTDQFAVPETVLANVRRCWPSVADGWASRVEGEFRTLCERHRATPRSVLPARYGLVVAVDTSDGPLVFRSSPDPRGQAQAAVAAALAKLGAAPRVHEVNTNNYGTWTVLDRVFPGTPLSQVDPETVDPQRLFAPLAAIQNQPPPLPDMPTIIDWLRDRLLNDFLTDLRPGTTVASSNLRRHALALLTDLARDHVPGLCHGDASSGNIISSGAREWMYIDPRGMSGEHAYDVAVLTNRIARLRNSPDLIVQISEFACVSIKRLQSWIIIADAARV